MVSMELLLNQYGRHFAQQRMFELSQKVSERIEQFDSDCDIGPICQVQTAVSLTEFEFIAQKTMDIGLMENAAAAVMHIAHFAFIQVVNVHGVKKGVCRVEIEKIGIEFDR